MVGFMSKRPFLKITPIVIGITLAGCAAQQTYVPELERAQKVYAQISQDPIVASLAGEDLQAAEEQLRRAEAAAATFRRPQTVAHEAELATLQTLTAQQRARSLTANHSVQVALGQDSLLSEQQIAAATIAETPSVAFGAEPIMAAAHAGDSGDIQTQLASLSQQLASLQAQLAASQQSMAPAIAEPAPLTSSLPAIVSSDPVPAIKGPAPASQAQAIAAAPQPTDLQLEGPDPLQHAFESQLEPILDASAELDAADQLDAFAELDAAGQLDAFAELDAAGQLDAATPLDANAQIAKLQTSDNVTPELLQNEAQLAEPAFGAAMAAPATTAVKALPGQEQIQRKLLAMNARPNTRGMSLTLGDRYFDGGSANLMDQRAARHLDNVAAVLQQNPGLTLDIEGHTDDQATPDDSQNLSANRAIAIKSALVLRGIDAQRIDTRGFGHTRPVSDNESPLGRLQNRRVELVFPVSEQGS